MKVYAMWHGGASYAHGYIPEDVESFDSLTDARNAFASRLTRGDWERQDFRYVNREHECVFTPAVDESASMWLWAADPSDDRDPYPWRVVKFGPRGGIRITAG